LAIQQERGEEGLVVLRAGGGDLVLRHRQIVFAQALLHGGLPVHGQPHGRGLIDHGLKQPQHGRLRNREAVLQVDRAEDCLDGVREDRVLVRPSVFISPRPSRMYSPSPRLRASPASAYMFTTPARILEISDSLRCGNCVYSCSATDSPSTASPRNSRRSLFGTLSFSCAKERCVSASRSISSDSSIPQA